MKSKRAKAVNISQKVKEAVWERDGHCCVVCGKRRAMPNAHFIPRSQGGLGIEENIVTLCTMGGCHYKFDFGTKKERKEIGDKIEAYLKSKYPSWDKSRLVYDKYEDSAR